jgi:hypothetical protein
MDDETAVERVLPGAPEVLADYAGPGTAPAVEY